VGTRLKRGRGENADTNTKSKLVGKDLQKPKDERKKSINEGAKGKAVGGVTINTLKKNVFGGGTKGRRTSIGTKKVNQLKTRGKGIRESNG